MTCMSRFFRSKTLVGDLFPALHGGDSGRDGLSLRPWADASPGSELDDGPEIAEDIAEDADPSHSSNTLPSPTVV